MKAMILAAGEGSRLRPLTDHLPKPMLPVAGRPALEWTIAWLRGAGIRDLIINLHHCPGALMDHFGDGSAHGVRISYSVEERILGTGGGIRRVSSLLADPFVVVYGDVLTNLDLGALAAAHAAGPAEPHMTLSLCEAADPTDCGIVELGDDGRVTRFVEKPAPGEVFSRLTNAGVLAMDPPLVDHIPAEGFADLSADVVPALIREGVPVLGHRLRPTEYLVDFGTPERYARAQHEWSAALAGCSTSSGGITGHDACRVPGP